MRAHHQGPCFRLRPRVEWGPTGELERRSDLEHPPLEQLQSAAVWETDRWVGRGGAEGEQRGGPVGEAGSRPEFLGELIRSRSVGQCEAAPGPGAC